MITGFLSIPKFTGALPGSTLAGIGMTAQPAPDLRFSSQSFAPGASVQLLRLNCFVEILVNSASTVTTIEWTLVLLAGPVPLWATSQSESLLVANAPAFGLTSFVSVIFDPPIEYDPAISLQLQLTNVRANQTLNGFGGQVGLGGAHDNAIPALSPNSPQGPPPFSTIAYSVS